MSSRDVTRADGMWEAIYQWILWRRFTLLVTLLTSRDLTCEARLSHFCCRTHFVRRDDVTYVSSALQTLSVSCLQKNILFMPAATLKPIRLEYYLSRLSGVKSSREITWHDDMRVCRLTWRELTWREDIVSPALLTFVGGTQASFGIFLLKGKKNTGAYIFGHCDSLLVFRL